MLTEAELAILAKAGGTPEVARKRRGDVLRFRRMIGKPLSRATPDEVRKFLKTCTSYGTRRRALGSLRAYYTCVGKDITSGISASERKAPTIQITVDAEDSKPIAFLLMLAAYSIPKTVLEGTLAQIQEYCESEPRLLAAFKKVNGPGYTMLFPWNDAIYPDRPAFPDADRLRWILEAAGYNALFGDGDV